MSLPHKLVGRLAWSRLKAKTKRKFLNAIPNRIYYRIVKERRREIVVLASQLKIPRETLRQHFEKLRQQAESPLELGDRMVQDLQEAIQLRQATDVQPDMWKKFLQRRSFEEALNEMRQRSEEQRQNEQRQAA